ncbi:MAG: DUF5668 domain-containing protein [Candidatus Margulisiibacteriota bacterium]
MAALPKRGLVSGILLICIGLVFLLDNLQIADASVVWPIIPIGIGVGMLIRYLTTPKG